MFFENSVISLSVHYLNHEADECKYESHGQYAEPLFSDEDGHRGVVVPAAHDACHTVASEECGRRHLYVF